MLRRALLVSLLAVGAPAPAATADGPVRQRFPFSDFTFPDAYLSSACGTEILSMVGGTFDVELFVDRSGVLVSEVDAVTRGSITWTNPANGASASEPMTGTSHAEYPDGIAVGKRAVVTITGHHGGSLTGAAPPERRRRCGDRRRRPHGVLFTAFDTADIVAISGNFASATARCDALT